MQTRKQELELRVGCAGVEQRRRCMREVPLGHEVVCFKYTIDIFSMDTNGDAHDHVLRAFSDTIVDAEEVGPSRVLKPKLRVLVGTKYLRGIETNLLVIVKVTVIDDGRVKDLSVGCTTLSYVSFGDHTSRTAIFGVDYEAT
jgi:hypothetical protein